jgi:hypothetical protein
MPARNPSNESEFLTRRHAAELIDSSEQLIDKYFTQGLLHKYYVGPRAQSRDPKRVTQARRKVLVKRSELLALLEKDVL